MSSEEAKHNNNRPPYSVATSNAKRGVQLKLGITLWLVMTMPCTAGLFAPYCMRNGEYVAGQVVCQPFTTYGGSPSSGGGWYRGPHFFLGCGKKM